MPWRPAPEGGGAPAVSSPSSGCAAGSQPAHRMASPLLPTFLEHPSHNRNRYGDWLRSGWRNVLDVVLRLHRLDLLPPAVIAGGRWARPCAGCRSDSLAACWQAVLCPRASCARPASRRCSPVHPAACPDHKPLGTCRAAPAHPANFHPTLPDLCSAAPQPTGRTRRTRGAASRAPPRWARPRAPAAASFLEPSPPSFPSRAQMG